MNSDDNRSMRSLIFSGMMWKFLERILAQGVSFMVSVILARILMPEDYGLVALVMIFINLANVFVVGGFSTALIQKRDANDVDFSTNFYCSLALSVLIYAALFFVAPWISDFYSIPKLTPVLRVFALRLPISSVSAIQHAYVERHMIFKRYFFSTLFGTVLSGLVGIVLAYQGFGVWALIAQYFTNTIVDILVLGITTPWRPRLLFSWGSARVMMRYGWKILAASLSGTFFNQLRSLLIGRVYTPVDLAYYDKGNQFPSLFRNNLSASVMAVLFPAIANISDDMGRVKSMTRRAVRISAYLVFPLLFGLAAIAEPLVLLLLTEKWELSIPFVRILSVSAAIGFVGEASLQALSAIGRSDVILKLEIIKKPFYLLFLIVGIQISVTGVAVTMLLYCVYATAANARPLSQYIGYTYREQAVDLGVPFLLSCGMSAVICLSSLLSLPVLGSLLFQIFTGAAFYVGVSWILKADSLFYLLDFLHEKIGNHRKGDSTPEVLE